MFGFKIVDIGRGPMLIERRADLAISRCRILFLLLWTVHREPPKFDQKLNAAAESECTTRQSRARFSQFR
jgi:hypothetical protein